jgi:hypothetical protein
MKYSYLFKICSTALVLFISLACEKEYKAGGPISASSNNNDVVIDESLGNFFEDRLVNTTQVFTTDARFGNFIKCSKGASLSIPANAFVDNAGNLITGNVELEVIEIYKRADMLLLNKSTNAIRGGERGVLVSGGQLYINGTYNGEQVNLVKTIEVNIPTENTGGTDIQMGLWDGEIQSDGNMLWTESSIPMTIKDTIIYNDTISSDSTWNDTTNYTSWFSYNFGSGGFGWVNCDKWYNDPRVKTDVSVFLPEGFDRTNAQVYYTYVNEPNLMGQFYAYNDVFTGGTFPIGIEMHFIIVAGIDDQLYYSIHTETITENHVVNIDDLQPVTDEDLWNAVNALQ